ncbi:hypothetical protein ACRCPT_34050 [Pseudomonas aeruginosa]
MRVTILKATASAVAISALCLTTGASFAASKKTKTHPDFTGVWVDTTGIIASDAPEFNPFKGRPNTMMRPRQCLTRRSENADMNACSRAQP